MAIFTAAVGAVTAFFATTIGAAIGQLLVGLALSSITQKLFGPEPDEEARAGIRGTIQLGADVPRSIIMGHYATAGSLVWHNHWGFNSGMEMPFAGDMPTYAVNNDSTRG